MKALLIHLFFFVATIVVCTTLCVVLAGGMSPAEKPSLIPRAIGIAYGAALIAGIAYFVSAIVWTSTASEDQCREPVTIAIPASVTAVLVVVGATAFWALVR